MCQLATLQADRRRSEREKFINGGCGFFCPVKSLERYQYNSQPPQTLALEQALVSGSACTYLACIMQP
jgi:hypothetical protein